MFVNGINIFNNLLFKILLIWVIHVRKLICDLFTWISSRTVQNLFEQKDLIWAFSRFAAKISSNLNNKLLDIQILKECVLKKKNKQTYMVFRTWLYMMFFSQFFFGSYEHIRLFWGLEARSNDSNCNNSNKNK